MADNEHDEHKRRIAAVFDRVAAGYDREALRFFAFAADRLVFTVNPRPGTKLLDVATGTGAAALAAAQALGPAGRVTAIDLAPGMLRQLEAKLDQFSLRTIDVHPMDAAALEFRRDYFDTVLSSFGLFFLPDMAAGLREWVRVTRPGGTVAFTCFGVGAFEPMGSLLLQRLERYGVTFSADSPRSASERLKDPQVCRALMESVGLESVGVQSQQLGYHLRNEDEWWEVVWNSGYRGLVERLTEAQQETFEHEHLAEVAALKTDKGLWMDVTTLFVVGRKPRG
jgi:ubiquinone/menaquinone biosynthesis C-methylase UbiE